MSDIPKNTIEVMVKGCGRCGQDHVIIFTAFRKNPIKCDGAYYKYWGMCGNMMEPVLLAQQEVEPSSVGVENYRD